MPLAATDSRPTLRSASPCSMMRYHESDEQWLRRSACGAPPPSCSLAVPTDMADAQPSTACTAGGESSVIAIAQHCPAALWKEQWDIDAFELKSRMYDGDASCVWRAVDRRSGITVALKAYERAALDEQARHQVAREIWLHAQLDHPSVIALYAAWKDSVRVYLVMEWAGEGSVLSYVQRCGGILDERSAVRMVLEPAISALAYIHTLGILHRDVKPENILMSDTFSVKIADFGLSIHTSYEAANTRLGTLDYLAPEVLQCPLKTGSSDGGEEAEEDEHTRYDSKVDVWSMGVLAYELLTGSVPFQAPSAAETLRRIASHTKLCVPEGLSSGAADFVSAALTRDPSQRPSMQQLLSHPWLLSHAAAAAANCSTPKPIQDASGCSRRGGRWSLDGLQEAACPALDSCGGAATLSSADVVERNLLGHADGLVRDVPTAMSPLESLPATAVATGCAGSDLKARSRIPSGDGRTSLSGCKRSSSTGRGVTMPAKSGASGIFCRMEVLQSPAAGTTSSRWSGSGCYSLASPHARLSAGHSMHQHGSGSQHMIHNSNPASALQLASLGGGCSHMLSSAGSFMLYSTVTGGSHNRNGTAAGGGRYGSFHGRQSGSGTATPQMLRGRWGSSSGGGGGGGDSASQTQPPVNYSVVRRGSAAQVDAVVQPPQQVAQQRQCAGVLQQQQRCTQQQQPADHHDVQQQQETGLSHHCRQPPQQQQQHAHQGCSWGGGSASSTGSSGDGGGLHDGDGDGDWWAQQRRMRAQQRAQRVTGAHFDHLSSHRASSGMSQDGHVGVWERGEVGAQPLGAGGESADAPPLATAEAVITEHAEHEPRLRAWLQHSGSGGSALQLDVSARPGPLDLDGGGGGAAPLFDLDAHRLWLADGGGRGGAAAMEVTRAGMARRRAFGGWETLAGAPTSTLPTAPPPPLTVPTTGASAIAAEASSNCSGGDVLRTHHHEVMQSPRRRQDQMMRSPNRQNSLLSPHRGNAALRSPHRSDPLLTRSPRYDDAVQRSPSNLDVLRLQSDVERAWGHALSPILRRAGASTVTEKDQDVDPDQILDGSSHSQPLLLGPLAWVEADDSSRGDQLHRLRGGSLLTAALSSLKLTPSGSVDVGGQASDLEV